jgi:hypothetical protein
LGFPTGSPSTSNQDIFWRHCRGIEEEEEEAPSSTRHQDIFWRRCRGGSRRLLRGEFFAHTSFTTLLFCFTLFILPASFFIKNPKKLESLVVIFTYLLLVSLE